MNFNPNMLMHVYPLNPPDHQWSAVWHWRLLALPFLEFHVNETVHCVCSHLCLPSFTWYNVLEVHPLVVYKFEPEFLIGISPDPQMHAPKWNLHIVYLNQPHPFRSLRIILSFALMVIHINPINNPIFWPPPYLWNLPSLFHYHGLTIPPLCLDTCKSASPSSQSPLSFNSEPTLHKQTFCKCKHIRIRPCFCSFNCSFINGTALSLTWYTRPHHSFTSSPPRPTLRQTSLLTDF